MSAIPITQNEAQAIDAVRQKYQEVGNDYQELLPVVSEVSSELGFGGKEVVRMILEQAYVQELGQNARFSRDPITSTIDQLTMTAPLYAEKVKEVLGIQGDYAKLVKSNVINQITRPSREKVIKLIQSLEKDVSSGEYGLSINEISAVIGVMHGLESVAARAELNANLEEDFQQIARYGIMRAGLSVVNEVELDKAEVYPAMKVAKEAFSGIKDREISEELKSNYESLDDLLKEKLGIKIEKVKKLTKSPDKEKNNLFVGKYKRQIEELCAGNEDASKAIYAGNDKDNDPKLHDRYNFIVDLFKEALLNVAVGDNDRAIQLVDNINNEFENLGELIQNPESLKLHYGHFTDAVENLGLPLKDNHSQTFEGRVEAYKAKKEAERKSKSLFAKVVDWFKGDDYGESFVSKETIYDVLGEYVGMFERDTANTQIQLSNSRIKSQEDREKIVKALMGGLVLTISDKKILEELGLKEGQTYQQDTTFTDQEFARKISEIRKRALELRRIGGNNPDGTYVKPVNGEEAITAADELNHLEYADHQLRSGARSAHESEVERLQAAGKMDNVVQIRGSLTEKDIGRGAGLMFDTLQQYVTKKLAGTGISPALDRQRKRQSVAYNVEEAWRNVVRSVPEFRALTPQNVKMLSAGIEEGMAQGKKPALALMDVVDQHFDGYRERQIGEKAEDEFTKGVNKIRGLKLLVNGS